jgi:hypothetical protein
MDEDDARTSLPMSNREMRIRSEWALLTELVARNPERLSDPAWRDTTLSVTIRRTPALPLTAAAEHGPVPDQIQLDSLLEEHVLRIVFARHFPALPMEAYLMTPVFHPNIHPETGFVCLWQRHSTTNTIEHALHKTVAMLTWRLFTTTPLHTMQPRALALCNEPESLSYVQSLLPAVPLHGIDHHRSYVSQPAPGTYRRRLS